MFDPYHKWLGIAPKDQPPTLYRLLGIDAFEPDDEVIDSAANRLMSWLQEFATGEHVAESQKLLNEIAAARVRLLNPGTKAEYDDQLRKTLSAAREAQEPAKGKQPSRDRQKRQSPLSDAGLPSGIHSARRRPAPSAPAKNAKAAAQKNAKAGSSKQRGSSQSAAHPRTRSRGQRTLSLPIIAAVGLTALAIVILGGWALFSKGPKPKSAPSPTQTAKVEEPPKADPPSQPPVVPSSSTGYVRGGGVFTGRSTVVLGTPPASGTPMAGGGKAPIVKAVEATAKPPVKPAAPAVATVTTPTAPTDGVDAARLQLASTMPADGKAADAITAPAPVDSKSVPASAPSPTAAPRPPADAVASVVVPAPMPAVAGDKNEKSAVPVVADQRLPVPGDASQQQAKKLLGDLFGGQTKKNREAQQRSINELFAKEAQIATEPASLYVVLVEARDRAVQLADLTLAETAVDKLIARFQVDRLAARTELLEKLQANKSLPADVGSDCADQCLDLVEVAIRDEDFPAADKLARLAQQFASKARNGELKNEAAWRIKEATQFTARWGEAEKARASLAKNDADADAHQEVGRYLCFQCDDWEAGLTHLSKGSDEPLKKLAVRSLAEMSDPAKLVELGDAWKKQSSQKNASKEVRGEYRAAARHWYALAEPWLPGLAKITCEKRLKEVALPSAKGSYPRRRPPRAVAPFDAVAAAEHQRLWARYQNTLPSAANSVGMKLVLIPPGEFRMGMDRADIEAHAKLAPDVGAKMLAESCGPRHLVRITHPFYIGAYEVTVGQFRAFATASKYKTTAETDGLGGYVYVSGKPVRKPEINWQNAGYEQAGDEPVVNVTYADTLSFCQWLGQQEGIEYRLPSEAEWEYVCRAGTETLYSFGSDPQLLPQYAWIHETRTKPVGKKLPNGFGIYDMLGNVYEWGGDWFTYDYYAKSPKDNPTGPSSATGDLRVIRGSPADCRSAGRGQGIATSTWPLRGFRVVRMDTTH